MTTDLIQVDEYNTELRLTLDEALELAQRKPTRVHDPSSRREEEDPDDPFGYASRSRSRNWHGGTFEENVEMAWRGDPETALQIKRTLGTVAGIHVAPRATMQHDVAGTTVDPVDSLVEMDGEIWRFVDTAGLRKRVNFASGMEYYASLRS